MWDIKTYSKRGKGITLQKGFHTKDEAEIFLSHEYKNREDVYVVEIKEEVEIDLSDKVGQWIWIYSLTRKEMFPYGILRKYSNTFIKIQTKEEALAFEDMAEYRTETIEKWIKTGRGELRSDGHFVVIKEYV